MLVYGTSSYEGIPYRHPFVTLHEVMHDGDVARLAAGQLMTPQMLSRPADRARKVPSGRNLAGTGLGAHGGDGCLVGARHGAHPVLRRPRRRPGAEENQWQALSPSAVVVQGMREPSLGPRFGQGRASECGNKAVHGAVLELLRQRSGLHGKHADSAGEIGIGDRLVGAVVLPERVYACFWRAQAHPLSRRIAGDVAVPRGQGRVSKRYLVKLPQRLSEFVNDNDHTYRNEVQPRRLSIGFQTACCRRKSELRWSDAVEQEAPSPPACRTCIKPWSPSDIPTVLTSPSLTATGSPAQIACGSLSARARLGCIKRRCSPRGSICSGALDGRDAVLHG